MNLQAALEHEYKFFTEEEIELNPSFAPTQPDLVKTIDYFMMSKFTSGDYDVHGEKKPFINKVDTPPIIASREMDIDVANINIIAETSNYYRAAWLYEKQLRIWMKDHMFSRFLNESLWSLPRYGSIIAAKVGGDIELIPVQDIIWDPTAKDATPPFTQKYRYTLYEFEEEAKKKKWKNYSKVLDDKMAAKENFVDVWARYGKLDDGANYHIAAVEFGDKQMGVTELYVGNRKFDYKVHHMERVRGRMLGRGVVEKTLENQIAANEVEYHFRKGLKWSSLRAFQSRDSGLAKNLLSQIDNGDILEVMSEISPIATEERNLGAFGYADQKWNENTNDRSFSWDIMKGQRPASGTPFSTSMLQSQKAGGYYELMRENYAIFLKEVIKDWIIPEFKKEKNKELMMSELSLTEAQTLKKLLSDIDLKDRQFQFLGKSGRLPDQVESGVMKDISMAVTAKKKSIEIPDSLYDNLSYKMTIDITGETIEKSQKFTMAQTLIGILGSNPQVMNDPRTSRAINKMIEWSGMDPSDIMDTEEMPQQNVVPLQRGGSVAAPRQASPSLTTSTQTV